MEKRVLVLFLGNLLRGDDGVGIELLRRISCRKLPENVCLEEGSTGGMILLGIIENYDTVLVVDAVDTGDLNNDVVIFTPSQIAASGENLLSLHSVSIADIIRFNRAVGERVPDITIFGIQVSDIGEHIGLSQRLLSMMNAIEERLYDLILKLGS